jgi:hypothetical protein
MRPSRAACSRPIRSSDRCGQALKADFKDSFQPGLQNSGKIIIGEQGLKFQQFGMTSSDLEFIASRKFQLEEIGRIFRIPMHMIGELTRATNNNIAQQAQEYINYTLTGYTNRWQDKMSQCFGLRKAGRALDRFDYRALTGRHDLAHQQLAHDGDVDDGQAGRGAHRSRPRSGGRRGRQAALPAEHGGGGSQSTGTTGDGGGRRPAINRRLRATMMKMIDIAEFRAREVGKKHDRPRSPFASGAAQPIRSRQDDARVVSFVFSDNSVDRYGDTIDARGWVLDNYNANPSRCSATMPARSRTSSAGAQRPRRRPAPDRRHRVRRRLGQSDRGSRLPDGQGRISQDRERRLRSRSSGIAVKDKAGRRRRLQKAGAARDQHRADPGESECAGAGQGRRHRCRSARPGARGEDLEEGPLRGFVPRQLLSELGYLEDIVEWEAEYEGDGSAVPQMLTDAMKLLGQALVAMTVEEVAELLGEEDGADPVIIVDDPMMMEEFTPAQKAFIALARGLQAKPAAIVTKDALTADELVALRALVAPALKAGKVLSAANAKTLGDAHEMITKGCTMIKDMMEKLAELRRKLGVAIDELNTDAVINDAAAYATKETEIADLRGKIDRAEKAQAAAAALARPVGGGDAAGEVDEQRTCRAWSPKPARSAGAKAARSSISTIASRSPARASASRSTAASTFRSFGEQLQAIFGSTMPRKGTNSDSRLVRAPTGAGEVDPTGGGFLVQVDFIASIFMLAHEMGDILPASTRSRSAPTLERPEDPRRRRDQPRHRLALGRRPVELGGRGRRRDESRPKFRLVEFDLKKLISKMT